MSFNNYKDPIITQRRKGDSNDPFIAKSESHQIENSSVVLSEIPNELERVSVTGEDITWFEKIEGLPSENEYVVNYVEGIIHFHESRNGLQLQFDFYGTGLHYIPSSRVYTKTNNGNVTETLKDLADRSEVATSNAEEAVSNINEVIVNAQQATSDAQIATQNANAATDTVNLKITEVDGKIEELDSTIINADTRISDKVAEINQYGTEQVDIKIYDLQTQFDSNVSTWDSQIDSTVSIVEQNENNRQTNEQERLTNEDIRVSTEGSRLLNESNRESAEVERENNESERIVNESTRESNEATRILNEQSRELQESQRQTDTANAISNAETATNNANVATENAQVIVDNTKYVEVYSSSTEYKKNNIVSYNGSSYIAKQSSLGNLPTNTQYFGLLAQRGVDGEGSVSSVNNINPDLNGNVNLTPENIGAEKVTNKGISGGYASLDSNAKIPLNQLPDVTKQQTYIVVGTSERNALTGLIAGDKAFETSTGDSYIWDGSQWVLFADADWANVSLDWGNINGKPDSSVSDIDDSVAKKHSHVNKVVLDGLSDNAGQLQYNGTDIGSVTSVNGQTGDVFIETEDEIIQQDNEPEGIVEGRLWLDTSDSAFQGTVFQQLDDNIGDLNTLQTLDKTNLVSAINEVNSKEVDTSTLVTKDELTAHQAETTKLMINYPLQAPESNDTERFKRALADSTGNTLKLTTQSLNLSAGDILLPSNFRIEAEKGAVINLNGAVLKINADKSNVIFKGIEINGGEIVSYGKGKSLKFENCKINNSLIRSYGAEGFHLLNCDLYKTRTVCHSTKGFSIKGGSISSRESSNDSEDLINIQSGSSDIEISGVRFYRTGDTLLANERNIIYAWGSYNIWIQNNVFDWEKNTTNDEKNLRFKNCYNVHVNSNTGKNFNYWMRFVATNEETNVLQNANIYIKDNICENIDYICLVLTDAVVMNTGREVRKFTVSDNKGNAKIDIRAGMNGFIDKNEALDILIDDSKKLSLSMNEISNNLTITDSSVIDCYGNNVPNGIFQLNSDNVSVRGGKVKDLKCQGAKSFDNKFMNVDIINLFDGYQSVNCFVKDCIKPTTVNSASTVNIINWVTKDAKTYGVTASRPTTPPYQGFMYYDTTLGKPIFWSGSAWKDASGATVA